MKAFDPRITPARPDLAAAHLRGRVQAKRFVEGAVHRVIEATAPLRHAPSPEAPLDSEALYGEAVTVYETNDEGWCWGQLADGYVGYLPANALARGRSEATHRVAVLRALVFPSPDVKAPPIIALPFGSRVRIVSEEKDFGLIENGSFVPLPHLAPTGATEPDFIATARRFVGTPYLWGGRTSVGIDCSGLVQISLLAAGIDCPRDSDMQAKLGTEVPFSGDVGPLQRGDLVCWRGHIGLVSDGAGLLHANAFHMLTVEEPLAEAIARIKASGTEVLTVRRLPGS
jgi:cell wall-associated NlpC family hydrolase